MLRAAAFLIALLCLLPVQPALAGMDEGWAAYEAGDFTTAMSEFQAAAEAGDPEAFVAIGDMYYTGTGVEQHYAEAAKWFRGAADLGDLEALNTLGDMYAEGQGVLQDFAAAAEWYAKGAEKGHAWAQQNLGWLYEDGRGVTQDYGQAAHWFGLAAAQGLDWGQYSLANLYFRGEGVAQDYVEAARLFRLSADQGVDWAQYRLGLLYQEGLGVEPDAEAARHWLGLAAAQGHGEAVTALASLGQSAPAQDPAPVAAETQIRVALLIGNSDYQNAPLNNPSTDITLVRPALESMGFDVIAVSDVDIGSFDAAVTEFTERADGADIALFYYAGHGFALNDGINVRNYLMAVSADVTETSDRILRSNGIPLDEIVDQVSAVAEVSLFFVDACRNDPRVSRGTGAGRGLAPVPGRGNEVFIGLSTRIGETAADGPPGEGSPFARAFVEKMTEPGLRVDDAFTNLRLAVEAETLTQRPEIARDDLSAPATVVLAAAAAN